MHKLQEKEMEMMDEILEAEVDEFIAKIRTAIDEIEAKNLQVDMALSISVMLKGAAAEAKDVPIAVAGRTGFHSNNPDILVCLLEELAQGVEENHRVEEETPTEKAIKNISQQTRLVIITGHNREKKT